MSPTAAVPLSPTSIRTVHVKDVSVRLRLDQRNSGIEKTSSSTHLQSTVSNTEQSDCDSSSAQEFEDADAVNNDSWSSNEPEASSRLLNSQSEPILATRPQPATMMTDVMWAVVEALQLMDDLDAAQQDFLRILKLGEQLHNRGRGVLQSDSHWPHTWQAAQALLQK